MNRSPSIVACLPLLLALAGCGSPEASETPAPQATAAKPEKPKAKAAATKPQPASPAAVAPAAPMPAPAPAVVDPEAEKQKEMLAKSQQAYEAMSDSQKSAADRIRGKIETAGIWSLDDDEVTFTYKHQVYFSPSVLAGLEQNRPAKAMGDFANKIGLKTAGQRARLYQLPSVVQANAVLISQDIDDKKPLEAEDLELLKAISKRLPELMDYYLQHKP